MRAAIFNPYLDTLGGGERYTMAVVEAFRQKGYSTDVEWKDASIKNKLEERFGIDLKEVKFIADIKRGDGYDVCFWLSDGSIPALRARKNLLHFQVPFHDVNGKTLINKMKLFRIKKIICNSFFTKKFIDKEYGVNSMVIYPPADIEKIKPKRKENIILSVGRFSQLKQAKRQDILITVFKKMFDSGFSDWKLVLAGGTEIGAADFAAKLKKSAQGYPIEIIESPSFETVKDLYGVAKIFWSASGYGVNDQKDPEKVEHFGITLVEAMAAGAVPLAYSAGGHKEIIVDGKNGYLWSSTGLLSRLTKKLINEKRLLSKLAANGKQSSRHYSYSAFDEKIHGLL